MKKETKRIWFRRFEKKLRSSKFPLTHRTIPRLSSAPVSDFCQAVSRYLDLQLDLLLERRRDMTTSNQLSRSILYQLQPNQDANPATNKDDPPPLIRLQLSNAEKQKLLSPLSEGGIGVSIQLAGPNSVSGFFVLSPTFELL